MKLFFKKILIFVFPLFLLVLGMDFYLRDMNSLYKEKWFTYGVKQPHRNRNVLLWQDDSIDGIKTGSTEAAGYCLVSEIENEYGHKILIVILNAESDDHRFQDLKILAGWTLENYFWSN